MRRQLGLIFVRVIALVLGQAWSQAIAARVDRQRTEMDDVARMPCSRSSRSTVEP
jgi:hypothetical protein